MGASVDCVVFNWLNDNYLSIININGVKLQKKITPQQKWQLKEATAWVYKDKIHRLFWMYPILQRGWAGI